MTVSYEMLSAATMNQGSISNEAAVSWPQLQTKPAADAFGRSVKISNDAKQIVWQAGFTRHGIDGIQCVASDRTNPTRRICAAAICKGKWWSRGESNP